MKTRHCLRIAELLERTGRLLDTEANASGLRPVHWEVLRYLERANRFSKSSAALTAYLGSTKGTVSQTIAVLTAKDLVCNEPDPRDRRRNTLSLTDAGRRKLAEDPLVELGEAIGRMPEPTRTALEEGLERLLTARLEARGRRPFGQCRECVHFASVHSEGSPHYCTLLNETLSPGDSIAICYEQKSGPSHAFLDSTVV